MSESTTKRSHKLTSTRVLIAIALGLVILGAIVGYKLFANHAAEQRFVAEMAQLGARVESLGYGRSSGIGRIPILGEMLTTRSQIELFIDNPQTVDAVLDRAAEFPELKRIWVDLNVFERSIVGKIEQKLPGMDVIFYTP